MIIRSDASRSRSKWLIDLLLCSLIVCAMLLVAYLKSLYPNWFPWLSGDYRQHLGAEYDSIAKAIRAGRGFSDPFHEPTGPTAWMPPLLPYLMAALYWLHNDDRQALIAWMVGLQGFSTLLSAMIVATEARGLRQVLAGYAIIVLFFVANFYQLFQQTHDVAFLLTIVGLLWMLANWFQRNEGFTAAILWGLGGGVCALSSPILGFIWAVLTLKWCWPQQWRFYDPKLTRLVWAAAMSILVVMPWTVRNRIELGTWFPIKPNGMYELWQSQCTDVDGVLDLRSVSVHPWSNAGEQRERYKQIGEIAFINEKGSIAKQEIRAKPLDFLNKVANRFWAAFIVYHAFKPMDEYYAGGWPIFFARCIFPLPVLAMFVILALRAVPLENELRNAIAILCFSLAPYILISYYDRYASMLIGMKMVVVLYGWQTVSLLVGRSYRSIRVDS